MLIGDLLRWSCSVSVIKQGEPSWRSRNSLLGFEKGMTQGNSTAGQSTSYLEDTGASGLRKRLSSLVYPGTTPDRIEALREPSGDTKSISTANPTRPLSSFLPRTHPPTPPTFHRTSDLLLSRIFREHCPRIFRYDLLVRPPFT